MKNLKIKKLLAVAVAGILTVGLVACGSSNSDSAKSDTASVSDAASGSYRTLDEIKEDGTINIGVFSDKNPFGYVDENGDYVSSDMYIYNGRDVLSTYVIKECYSANIHSVSFMDNLYGSITEDNADEYLVDNLHLNVKGRKLIAKRFEYFLNYYSKGYASQE